jgi:hypothetical protein
MHRAPYWSHDRARRMAGRMARAARITAVFLAVGLAVGIAAGVATAVSVHGIGYPSPPGPRHQGKESGAIVVGFSMGTLAILALRIGYAVREHRRRPDATFGTRWKRGLTLPEYVSHVAACMLLVLVIAGLGLLTQYQYG